MKRIFLLGFISIFFECSGLLAQITYDPGYYVNNNGDTIYGLIRNLDWKNNPQKILFKSTLDDDVEELATEDIMSFVVADNLPFRRFTVLWDENINRLDEVYSSNKEPRLVSKTFLLRQLTFSGFQLYEFCSNNQICFYISSNDSVPQLLVFKYYLENETDLKANNSYQAQLYLLLKCDCLDMNDFELLEYSKKSIIQTINKYNNCSGIILNNESHGKSVARKKIEYGISAGMQLSSLEGSVYKAFLGRFDANFTKKIFPVAGLDFEYYLPFKRNIISLCIQPEISYYSSEAEIYSGTTHFDLLALNAPLQLRYSWYLRNSNRIFANFGFGATLPIHFYLDGDLKYYEPHSNLFFAAGIGAQFGKKYLIYISQYFPHDYLLMRSATKTLLMNRTTLSFIYRFNK